MSILQSIINDTRTIQYNYGAHRLKNIIATTSEKLIPFLHQQEIDKNKVVLLITGSDGRKENRTDASSIEMIAYIYDKNQSLKILLQDVAKKIGEVFMGYNRLSIAKKVYGSNKVEVEPKNFEKIVYFEDPYSDYTTIFPTRFIDGAMIYGSEYLYKELYDNFEKDIQEMPQNSFKPFKSRITYAADINNVGIRIFKGKNFEHFNRDKKEIYYQKTPEVETGVKMGPLRYVQYKLAYLIVQLIRNHKISYNDFKTLEGFIHKKIEFLRNYVKGGMSEAIIQDLSLIYYTFLRIHHTCQKEYKNVEGMYIYQLKNDEEKILKEMLIRLHKILSELTVV